MAHEFDSDLSEFSKLKAHQVQTSNFQDSVQETVNTNSLSVKDKANCNDSGEVTHFEDGFDAFLKNDEMVISEISKELKVGVSEAQEFEVQDNTHVPEVAEFDCPKGMLGDGAIKNEGETQEFEVQDNTHVPEVADFECPKGILGDGAIKNGANVSEAQEFEVQDHTHVPEAADFDCPGGILGDGAIKIEENTGFSGVSEAQEVEVQDNTHVPNVTDFECPKGMLGDGAIKNGENFSEAQEFEVQDHTHVPEVTDSGAIKNGGNFSETQELEFQVNSHVPKVTDFECDSGILGDEVIKREATICLLNGAMGKNLNIVENLGAIDDASLRRSLKIEVIDDTAMIEASEVGKSCSVDERLMGFDVKSGRNRRKNNANQVEKENGDKRHVREGNDWKREKRAPRKGKGKNVITCNETKKYLSLVEACDGCERKEGEERRFFSRKELEDMRFIGLEEQRKKWIEVYCGLGDAVRREYDGLVDSKGQKHIRLDFNPRRHIGKENVPAVSGNDHSEHLDDQEANLDTTNSRSTFPLSRDNGFSYEENVYEESDDSDDDYSSIQRPAFSVFGEPDFDSGPPEDGLEYLRRVRWEASQLPKVKVAKVESSKINKEQTCYIPQLPVIANCLEHLLPLKEWEEAFLAEFSELRKAISRLEASGVGISSQLHSATLVHQEHSSFQLSEGIVLEKFDGLMSGDDESCPSDAGDDCPSLGNSRPTSSLAGGFGNSPTLSVILKMDSVARVSMLKKRITAAENMSTLSRDDCLWLFALCAAVDSPLHADTSAALLCLLRKCASLRAEKSELDDEVVMLNMLATISGRYFGQSKN